MDGWEGKAGERGVFMAVAGYRVSKGMGWRRRGRAGERKWESQGTRQGMEKGKGMNVRERVWEGGGDQAAGGRAAVREMGG